MRKITKNERLLLALLLGALFVFLNVFAFQAVKRLNTQLKAQHEELRNQQVVAETWLEERTAWAEKKAWLDENQPKLGDEGAASSALLQHLTTSARRHSITVLEQKLLDAESTSKYREVSVRLKVSGSLKGLSQWLCEVQEPKLFQAVKTFSVKSAKKPPDVICVLEVARWYAPLN